MNIKRVFTLLLAAVLVFSCIPRFTAQAAQTGSENHYNIVLVIDSSGSLENEDGIRSDPDRLRFDAVDMFLDLLTESGNNVSVISFKGNGDWYDSSDKAMREACLVLDTPLTEINTREQKESLKKQVKAVPAKGFTDIGTALLAAVEKLEGKTEENGMESIIVLFTDGCTETGDYYYDRPEQPVYKQSLANRDAAVARIRNAGITLYGVFLNKDGRNDSTEVQQIVHDAKTENENTSMEELKGLYHNITSADQLVETYQEFYALISNTGVVKMEKTDSFRIPGSGVKDVNICIIADNEAAIQNSTVTLTPPNAPAMTGDQMLDIKSQGKTYAVYKITDPPHGIWNLQVNTPAGAGDVQCSMIVNMDIEARMQTSPAPEEFSMGKPISVSANLFDNGEKLTDPLDYAEYECFLQLVNADAPEDAEPLKVSMSMDGSGTFTAEYLPPDYGVYYATAVFRCGDSVNICSDSQVWALKNNPPDAVDRVPVTIEYGLKQEGWKELDLRDLVTDAEDEFEDLDVQLRYDDYPEEAVKKQDNILRLDGTIGGSGRLTIRFVDTQGSHDDTVLDITYADVTEKETRNTVIRILLIIAALLLLWRALVAAKRIDGVIKLDIPLMGGTEKRELIRVTLKLDAMECINKNLLQILRDRADTMRILAAEDFRLRDDAEKAVEEFFTDHSDALQDTWIRPAGYRFRECVVVCGSKKGVPLTYGKNQNIELKNSKKLQIRFDVKKETESRRV